MEAKIILLKEPEVFSRYLLGFEPFSYQLELLKDRSKRIVACMGRQTGKSTTIAAKAVWFGMTHANTNTLIVSATMRQSMLMFDKVIGYILGSPFVKRSVNYKSRTRVKFTNGSWIIALPCGRSGFSLRGHTAHLVILDEAAFIPEEVITNVVLPMISTTDGSIWMLSTPWDKEHVFYRCFTNQKDWSIYHLPSSSNPLIKKEFLQEQKELIGEERYRMEYEADFIDDAKSYFPMTLLRSCAEDYHLRPEAGSYGGYDPGGKESLAAFATVVRSDEKLKCVHYFARSAQTYTESNLTVADYHKVAYLAKLLIDQTGTQGAIIEHCKELGLPAEGITLSERNREEILTNLRILFETKQILIPRSPELLNALNCIEYERTRIGAYKFFHRRGTHDDLGYALALACWAARGDSGEIMKIGD